MNYKKDFIVINWKGKRFSFMKSNQYINIENIQQKIKPVIRKWKNSLEVREKREIMEDQLKIPKHLHFIHFKPPFTSFEVENPYRGTYIHQFLFRHLVYYLDDITFAYEASDSFISRIEKSLCGLMYNADRIFKIFQQQLKKEKKQLLPVAPAPIKFSDLVQKCDNKYLQQYDQISDNFRYISVPEQQVFEFLPQREQSSIQYCKNFNPLNILYSEKQQLPLANDQSHIDQNEIEEITGRPMLEPSSQCTYGTNPFLTGLQNALDIQQNNFYKNMHK